MNARTQALLWLAQRASAAVLALCVVVHLATMIYAVKNGLSAGEILGRTRGNYGWFGFYTLFVFAVAVHAPIGLRTIAAETFGWRSGLADALALTFGVALALWGMRAVLAVFV